MLYHLLYGLRDQVSLFNVFRYPSFRILMAGMVALLFGLLLGPWMIRLLRYQQHGVSNVREDVPEQHQKKAGTPTMGGVLVLAALTLGALLFADLSNRYVWAVMLTTLGFGAIGFTDDWLKVSRKNSKGLPGKLKLVFQAVIFLAVVFAFFFDWRAMKLALDTTITLPFVPMRHFHMDLGWFYLPFALLVVMGTSHAVNLTDGLDGLAIGPTIVSTVVWLVLSYVAGTVLSGFNLAEYLGIPFITGAQEMAVVCSAVAGAAVAFLWFNTYPASVFMGDVGSLALGGTLGALAVFTKNEFASAILHGLFLMETVSVIVQVISFKTTGKRVFLMAPIHHHFEKLGWAEPKIIVRFWIISVLLAGVALASLKVR